MGAGPTRSDGQSDSGSRVGSRGRTNRGTAEITYWVWTAGASDFSLFQGFRRSQIENTSVLKHITTLPSNVFELFVEKSRAAFARMNGVSAYRIPILDQVHLEGLKLYPSSPFNVFVSNSNTWEAVETYRRLSKHPVLHVTRTRRPGTLNITALGRAELRDLYVQVLDFLEQSGEPEMVLLPNPGQAVINWDGEASELPERGHGVTVPNEMALKSMGYALGKLDPLPATVMTEFPSGNVNSHIVSALRASVEAVRTQRSRFWLPQGEPPAGPPIDTVVWAAGLGSHLPDDIPPGASTARELTRVLKTLLRQRDYPAFTNLSVDEGDRLFASQEAQAAIAMRKLELELCTGALGVVAAGHFAPVIRIRPAVNLVKGEMRQMAACAAASGPRKMWKLSKLAHTLEDKLAKEIGSDCMEMIERSGEGIKLVSNAPLEFIPLRGLPLQLRRTVSRLPVTPGAYS